MQLTIDKEFQSLLLPLTPDEYQQLKQNIIEDGCREPLVIWNNIIVDGHNRYQICTHNDIPFTTVSKDFADREAVKDWIDRNQYGRRNLTSAQLDLIMHRIHERRKKTHTEAGQMRCGKNCHSSENGRTRDIIAKEMGVSPRTVNHAVEFGKALEQFPDVQEAVMQGKPVIKRNVIAAAKAKKEGDDEMAKKILEHGTKVPVVIIVPKEDDERIKYIFEQTKLFDKWEKQLKEIKKEITDNIGVNPALRFLFKTFFVTSIDKVRTIIKNAKPISVCSECQGKGCDNCSGAGFIATTKGD